MTTSIMNTAQSGLQAAQAGLLVTSQNIAGASVDGFSRRNATAIVSGMAPNSSILMGTSFSVEGFTRYHSGLLETQRRSQQGRTSYSEALVNATETLDALLADQSNSLATAYSEFFNAAGMLVSDPESIAYRSNLTSKADVLVQRMMSISDSLRIVEQDSLIALKSTLSSVKDVTASLARVNVKIQEGTSQGNFTPSADYLDERDRLLMKLQELVGGQSVINSDGTASHYIQGVPLVERGFSSEFMASSLASASGPVSVRSTSGESTSMNLSWITGGQAGGYIEALNNFLPDVNRRLDAIAIATVVTVNGANTLKAGDGTQDDLPIFGFKTVDGDVIAPHITISSVGDINDLRLRLDPSRTNSADPPVFNSDLAKLKASNLYVVPRNPEDYDVAPGISSAWAADIESLRSAFVQPISDFIGVTGTQIASWVSERDSNLSVMQVLNDRRESISGVNLDEEAANMVKFQQIYAASSKLIQTGNQMFETLLAMIT